MTNPREIDPTEAFFQTVLHNPDDAVAGLDKTMRLHGAVILEEAAAEIGDGSIPILFANHQSFADALVLSRVTSVLVERTELEGFRIPASASSESQPLHQVLLPIYHRRGLYPIGVYIDAELKLLGAEERRVNHRAAVTLVRAPEENFGIAIFPEAAPHSGTRTAEGTIRGMQQVTRNDLEGYASIFEKRYQRDVLFVPIAINGSYELYDPEINMPGIIAVRAVCGSIEDIQPVVDITVGEPIHRREVTGNFNEFLMRTVATMLPVTSRGAYA